MTSVVEEQQNNGDCQSEPPTKRRRGGRRSTNPEISAEERKRRRVLKNRESAMRSLAKKAEHSARLENLAREALEDYRASRETLQKLINTAIGLRTSLNNVPEDLEKFVSEVEASINRATSALVDVEEDPDAMKLPDHDLHVNGDIADNK